MSKLPGAVAPLDEPTSIFDPRVRGATFAILLLVALSAFEGLAVAAALPQVAASLGDVGLLPWVITSYLLTSGVATVAAGALVDQVGVRRVFRVSVAVFVVGGVLAGMAPSMGALVLARALQGAGAGAVNAVGLTAVGLVFPRRLVGRAFAANTTVWGVMSVGGPALASLLLTVASWRWIFLVNLPLGAVALAVGWSALPDRRDGHDGAALRMLDLVLLTAFTLLLLIAVDRLDTGSLVALVAAVGVLTWAVRRSRGRSDALLRPRHALDTPLGPLGWGIALLLVGTIGTQSYLPVYVSGGRDGGTALTAWSVLFFVLGWTTGANLASRAVDRYTAVVVTRVGAVVVPVALAVVAGAAAADLPLAVVFVALVPAGMGVGCATNAALTLLRELADDAELGRASAAHQFVRNLGFAIGNALFGALLLFVVGAATGDVERIRAVLGGAAGVVDPEAASAIRAGFAVAAAVSAGVSVLGSVPLLHVHRFLRARDLDPVPPSGPPRL